MSVLVVLLAVIVPLLALVLAYQARESAHRAADRAERLAVTLGSLERKVAELTARPAADAVPARTPTPLVTLIAEPPPPAPPATPAAVTVPVVQPPPPVAASAAAAVAPGVAVSPPAAAAPARRLEERIGVTWFTRIGAAVFILGALYFFKYAVDNNWIGPWGRVALGVLAGVGVLAFAERQSSRARAVYVQVLVGVGLALLFVSSYAAYGFYRILPATVAFAALAAVAAIGGALALRHRAEVVLVIALIAALANPVLLSTGDDRAAELFAYLALVSAATLLVALKARFAAAPWLALLGVTGLWLGWYGAFFKVAAPLADVVTGRPIPGFPGAYLPLDRRIVPLVFVAACAALWIWFARRARALEWRPVAPVAMLLAAIVLGQWGCGALLGDRPPLVAAVLAVWAVVTALLLRRVSQVEALAVPLVASFVFLLGHVAGRQSSAEITLVLAGSWLGVYAVALVIRARLSQPQKAEPTAWVLLAVALAMGVVVATTALPVEQARLLCVSLAVLAMTAVALVGRGAPAWVAAPVAVASLLALLAAPVREAPPDVVFLILVAAWSAVYLASGYHQLLVRRAPADTLQTLLALGGPVGFVAVTLMATRAADSGLRAVCAAGAGAVAFAFGAALLRRRAEARDAATAIFGASLGLITLAVGLAFSGVTITLVWALLAATVAYLAARALDARWLAGASALFVLALFRLLIVDVPAPMRDHARFVATRGLEGRLAPAPLANPRAIALLGVAIALGIAAAALARNRQTTTWRNAAVAAAVIAHLLLVGLLVSEVQLAVTVLPATPSGQLPAEEFRQVLRRFSTAVAAQENRRAAAATLTLGGYGALLLGIGFAVRSVLHRWLGLVILAATLGKMVLWDIWNLPRLYQVLVLVSVGALLLGAGFLYARFGRRLLGFLKAGAAAARLDV